MERKIGEIFEYNGGWYQAVEQTEKSCKACYFYSDEGCFVSTGLGWCRHYSRNDNKSIIFKKLEKVGEPIIVIGRTFQKFTNSNSCVGCVFCNENNGCDKCCYMDEPCLDNEIWIELKQNKEDMEEKKIQLSKKEYDYIKNKIEHHILPGKLHKDVYEDKVTEDIMKLFSVDTNYSNSEKIEKSLKPFDLQKAREGKPVCTRDGRKARIICFDRENEQPIVALIEKNEEESIDTFFNNGHSVSKTNEAAGDLMMLPEKKEVWVNVYKNQIHDTPESAEEGHKGITDYIKTIRLEWEE